MTALDDEVLPEVLALINEVGISGTLTRRTVTPNANGAPVVGTAVHSVTLTPPAPIEETLRAETLGEGRSGLHRASRTVTYMAGSGAPATPQRGDTVALAGRSWSVERVEEYRSGASVAAWELTVI